MVDDDETFRNGLATNLRDDGHDVVEHGDPRDVLSDGIPAGIDVAIVDYEMPYVNGFTVAEKLRASHPEIAIVMVTAYWTAELQERVATLSFLGVCRKPLEYDELHDLVHRTADRSRSGG